MATANGPSRRAKWPLMHGRSRPTIGAIVDTRTAPSSALVVPAVARTGTRSVQVLCDDPAAAGSWVGALVAEGLGARCTSLDGATRPGDMPPDAWVLHLTRGLPAQLSRLRELRGATPLVPLLIVCQGLRDLDHVLALEMGADDVIDAALGAPVVAARLRALWRRCGDRPDEGQPEQLNFGRLQLLRRERRAVLGQHPMLLTEGEFELLWLLAARAGHVVQRTDLVPRLRGLEYHRADRSIDCCVYRLRAKLGDDDPEARRIRTVRNRGYLFSPLAW
jgi:two-component system response regulator ParR